MSKSRKSHIRFDWAIKRILRHKANFGILEGFLSVVIGEEVKITDVLGDESNKQKRTVSLIELIFWSKMSKES